MVKRLPSRLAAGNARLLDGTVGGAAMALLNTDNKRMSDKIKFRFIKCFNGYTLSVPYGCCKDVVADLLPEGNKE